MDESKNVNLLVIEDEEIDTIWNVIQKSQLVFHPTISPDGNIQIDKFLARKAEKPFMLILDRNIYSALIHFCKEGELRDEHEAQLVGIIMTWAAISGVRLTSGAAVMEYASSVQDQETAVREIQELSRVFIAFIKQKQRMLYLVYLFFNYSVLDTMNVLHSSSCFEVSI